MRAFWAFALCCAFGVTPGRSELNESTCETIIKSTFEYVVAWDKEQVSSILQAVMSGSAKRISLCSRLGFGVPLPIGEKVTGNVVNDLADRLVEVRECLDACASASCHNSLQQLKGSAAVACSGLKMLKCQGGLPSSLQHGCSSLNTPWVDDFEGLGAVRSAQNPYPAEKEQGTHLTYLVLIGSIPVVAMVANLIRNRLHGPRPTST